ncbi:fibronectin [Bacillus clarus]|uniref:Fibronectin n=1 Tax=Bacillus clarus TaxID=2338372 RepID=A0ABX9KMK8_9BACI|nr:fibronectin [Bacillus clarus]
MIDLNAVLPKIGVSHLHIFEKGVFCRRKIKGTVEVKIIISLNKSNK